MLDELGKEKDFVFHYFDYALCSMPFANFKQLGDELFCVADETSPREASE
jgi:hypothetical protein